MMRAKQMVGEAHDERCQSVEGIADIRVTRDRQMVFPAVITPASDGCRILWNDSTAAKLLYNNPFPQLAAEEECLVHRVSLCGVSGLSVGFDGGAFCAILTYKDARRLTYKDASSELTAIERTRDPIIWPYFPLSSTECILGLWTVTCKYSNRGTCALIVSSYLEERHVVQRSLADLTAF